MSKLLSFLRSVALLIARVALGGILIAHGWERWQVRKIDSQIQYLQQYGVPYPDWAAWGATIFELIGGIFLIVGALTPLVALVVLVEQVLIISWISWRNDLYLLNTDNTYAGGYEYSVALAALALLLTVFGAGAMSIDRLFRRKKPSVDEEEPAVTGGPTRAPAPPAGPMTTGTSGTGSTAVRPASGTPGPSFTPPPGRPPSGPPGQIPPTTPLPPVNQPPASMTSSR